MSSPPPAPVKLEPPAPPVPEPPLAPRPRARRPLLVAALVTALVTAVSYLTPDRYAATAVGVCFLGATWLLVLRHDAETVRAYGLSLGGLLEPVPLEARRLVREGAAALLWALVFAAIVFPPFWFGYRFYWHAHTPFVFRPPASIFDEIAGQLVVIALPEEAFYRGYLQTSLDRVFKARLRVLGAELGPGLLIASAIFALGHFLTIRHPARLAVFFPSLIFGFLRARTGGIGASFVFHALCNLFSATLGRGFGITP